MRTGERGPLHITENEGKTLWVADELMTLKRRAKTPAGLTLSLTR